MKRNELLDNLKAAKGFTSVLLIEDMIKLIEALEPEVEVRVEKEIGITKELAEDISYRINACLNHNCVDLVSTASIELELTHDNRIEISHAEIDTDLAMEHIDAVLDQFIVEEEVEEDETDEEEADETAAPEE